TTEMHMPFQLRFCSSAAAAAATFLAVSRLIGSPYGVGLIVSGTASFGLFGSGGTCANAPVPVASARHKAPAITVKRRITSSLRMDFGRLCPGGAPTRLVEPEQLIGSIARRLRGSPHSAATYDGVKIQ